MPAWGAILMSLIVFAGSAQIAALTILGAGGGLASAIGAATLMNSRFLPMGIAIGPSLPGGPVKRAAQGQPLVDASWALASDGEGGFDRHIMFGSSAIQFVGWQIGTIVGVFGGSAIGDPKALGIDAIYPAFFLALMIVEIRGGRALGVAALGGLIAFVLVPITPGRRAGPGRLARVAGRADPAMSTGTTLTLVLACAVITAGIKATGPVALGGRDLPLWFSGVVAMMAPALFAALVVTQALADGRRLGGRGGHRRRRARRASPRGGAPR